MPTVTNEMRQAVRAEECAVHGHTFDTICVVSTGEPLRVVCSNCGRSWKVEA